MSAVSTTCSGILYLSFVALPQQVGYQLTDLEELLFQSNVQSLNCDVLKECELGKIQLMLTLLIA